MAKRFLSIYFRYLLTDWFTIHRPSLRIVPFVLAVPDHGRMVVKAVNELAQAHGIQVGMAVADARAIVPVLQVLDDKPDLSDKLLKALAEWCIRYTPAAAVDAPDGIILDVTGCAHLWGGEESYLQDITARLKRIGYTIQAAIADTIGTAWAVCRFAQDVRIVKNGAQSTALLPLPPDSLRIEADVAERLDKLGLRRIRDFIGMPRPALRRRFGQPFLQRLDQALGYVEEIIQPVQPVEAYQERLPCLEPIATATGIEIALKRLLETLCLRLQQEQKGLRQAIFKCFRVDGKMEAIEIGTNRASHNIDHLFRLFEPKIQNIEPALGIELFLLQAPKVDDVSTVQEKLWNSTSGLDNIHLAELLDRIAGRVGADCIHRYIPDEHYWPERSFKPAASLQEKSTTAWQTSRPRPVHILSKPEAVDVTAPIPDYPPMLFRYKGKIHKIIRADGPERIEQEWWLQQGQHRDYYSVEDEEGQRYWIFRSGHYDAEKTYQWFIHGFFA